MALISAAFDTEERDNMRLIRDGESVKEWNSAGMKLSRAAWSIGFLVLLFGGSAAGLLISRSGGTTVATIPAPTGEKVFIQAEEFATCELYFAVGKDCQKKNIWECDEDADDGSQAYRCCCTTGYGDFAGMTGAIVWDDFADHVEMCADLSMPYVGTGTNFNSAHLQLGECAVGDGHPGNPYKMFNLPKKGEGQIKWATHPDKCLGVDGGKGMDLGVNGAKIMLMDCSPGPWDRQMWDVPVGRAATKSHQIRWKGNPDYCLNVAGGKAVVGADIALFECTKGWSSQKFHVKRPTKEKNDDKPSLFCISLMMSFGYEIDMIKSQLAKGVGIFDCPYTAVYSNESIKLSRKGEDDFSADVMNGSLAVKFGGKWNTALNTPVFIRFWTKVLEDPKAKKADWIVKTDPDAVFLPSRLREVLRHKYAETLGDAKSPVYLNNCYLGMHGPIEVLSRQALELWGKEGDTCQEKSNNISKIGQEDFYFRECWEYVGIKKENVYNILLENGYACNERPVTRDGRHPCFSRQISMHPFKTVKAYFSCYNRAVSQYFSEPMNIYSEPPSKDNYHHA